MVLARMVGPALKQRRTVLSNPPHVALHVVLKPISLNGGHHLVIRHTPKPGVEGEALPLRQRSDPPKGDTCRCVLDCAHREIVIAVVSAPHDHHVGRVREDLERLLDKVAARVEEPFNNFKK